MKFKNKLGKKSFLVVFEISSLIISTFAFLYFLSFAFGAAVPLVKAQSTTPSTCCLETNSGAVCQDINQLDSSICKNEPIGTSCDTIDNCQKGCCYSQEEGICSLNAPKEKCLANGGNWSNSPTCNIAQCQLGCCVLGEEASILTVRQCTKTSNELNLDVDFKPLNSDGTCDSYTGLSKKGACITPTNDFSGENNCKFTTKGKCGTGTFYENYLCTAKDLNTVCTKTKQTTCVSDKDQIYYLDSCNNTANVYDSAKYNDDSYWEQVIKPQDSCTNPGKDCGNCDYASGSVCASYRLGKDTKATYGNNVCRDLNCANGKKHGESWCISDFSSESPGVAPVGSRAFVGKCVEGEISIEPCADFNQEICVQGSSNSFSEAKCVVNDWRSCIAANEKEDYFAVQNECKKYPQCTMFNDISGVEDINTYPGFKETTNKMQGSVGGVGEDANKVITYCVPKSTPGMVFWSTETQKKSSILNLGAGTNTNNQKIEASNDYGGSLEETNAICSLGSFTCVTERKQSGTGLAASETWANTECYDDKTKTPVLIDELNERCRMLGPCGVYVNVAGELGSNTGTNSSFFKRIHIDKNGKTSNPYIPDGFGLSENYLSSLAGKSGLVPVGSLSSITAAVISLLTGKASDSSISSGSGSGATLDQVAQQAADKNVGAPMSALESTGMAVSAVLLVHTLGATIFPLQIAGAAIAGYAIGQLIGKAFGLSNSETDSLSLSLAAGFGFEATANIILFKLGLLSGPYFLIVMAVGIVVMVVTYMFTYSEVEYWVTSYKCEAWQPPEKGDCNVCNSDVRTCSEYRCRSLGLNCHYYVDNGEPGYCASTNDIWSATIKPWPEIISEEHKYSDIGDMQFKITGLTSEKVPANTPITFGVITDKYAKCKIDTKHTKTFDEMAVDMIIDSTVNCAAENCGNQGTHHSIGLSPVMGNTTGEGTLGFHEGENQYFIRCKNYAGQYNLAEFVVKITGDKDDDRSPPIIKSFNPVTNSYLALGQNSKAITLWVNEPSECKYSDKYDLIYNEMPYNMTCLTNPESSFLAQWPCYTTLNNLSVGENKFFFKCKDQPPVEGEPLKLRNTNENSKQYTLNVCATGLNITSLSPQNEIVGGKSPVAVELKATTSGCVSNGKSECSFKFNNLGTNASDIYVNFLNTNANTHSQLITSMPSGDNNISVKCVDDAGNSDQKTIEVQVDIDNSAPVVLRNYLLNKKLIIVTNENSQCAFTKNSSIGCAFTFADNVTLMAGTGKSHDTESKENENYYIKCKDGFNNEDASCSIVIKTY